MRTFKYLLLLTLLLFSTNLYSQDKTLIWNVDRLESIKEMISVGGTIYKAPYDRLTREADKALSQDNPTVATKKIVPPSGDKHDYVSLSRYWWPNPDTEDGLPYVRKDGVTNPEIKDYDRHILSDFSTQVVNSTLAWYFGGEKKYANHALSLLMTWFVDPETKMNPNVEYGQMVPGINEGKGRPEGILDTYSLVEVIDAIILLKRGGELSLGQFIVIQAWFKSYSEWLLTSQQGIAEATKTNNHAVAFDVQLAVYAAFGDDMALAEKTVNEFAPKRIAMQIDDLGRQKYELARTNGFAYSVFNLSHIIEMCLIGRSLGIDLYGEQKMAIRAAIDYLTPYLDDNKSFPYEQIGGWSRATIDFANVLRMAAHLDSEKSEEYRYLHRIFKAPSPTKQYLFTLLWD